MIRRRKSPQSGTLHSSARQFRSRALRSLAIVLAAGLLVSSQPSSTLASWTSSEYAGGEFSAATIAPPKATASCALSPGLLGAAPQITVKWAFATPSAGYTVPKNVQYGYLTNGLLEPVLTNLLGYLTTTPSDGGYTTVFGSGLLSGLLGGNMVAGIRTLDSSGWTSTWLVATASMGLLGANPSCSVSYMS